MKKNNSISQRGVALLISLFSIMMLSFIAVEISYDTSVDYIISSKDFHKLKAYYAAKSGVELSLLRILLYKQAKTRLGQQSPVPLELLDTIWNFPFSWPIDLPGDLSEIDKQSIQTISGESFLGDVQYQTAITSEGDKIDLSAFATNKPALANAVKTQLSNLFKNHIESLETDSEITEVDYPEVIGNIKDWADEDEVTDNNSSEASLYEDKNLPPNRAYRTLEELRMVSGVTDLVFEFLKPYVTVYGVLGINPNTASRDVLKAIHPSITDEVLDRMDEYFEQSPPFSDENSFFSFLSRFNVDTDDIRNSGVRLYFSGELNFLVKSVGKSGSIVKEVQAVVYDEDGVLQIVNSQGTETGSAVGTTTTTTTTIPQGRPNIIYWYER